jgi:hypothetical protein
MNNINISFVKNACGAGRVRIAFVKFLAAFLFASALAAPLFAQAVSPKGVPADDDKSAATLTLVPQTPESAAAALKTARSKGSELVGIIELPGTMIPQAIEHRSGQGQIVAVYIRSLTTEWTGVSYSTKDAPITGFTQAVQRFSNNHLLANPEDSQSLFGIDAFAVKATADALEQWMALFPDAKLAYARDLSPEGKAQSRSRREKGLVDVYIPRHNSDGQKLDSSSLSGLTNDVTASSGSFMPTSAILNIDAPSSDRRMISGSFSWSSESALSGLSSPLATLEIQTLFWNHAPQGQPKATYVGDKIDFAASWSSAYYDTNFLDDSGVQGDYRKRSYTVGATNPARAFKPNTLYTFWISTKAGDLAANLVEFSAQRGRYIPVPTFPDPCVIDPSLCVWPILGATDWFSPSVPAYGKGATQFSIVAPTIFPFSYPTPVCNTPPGQPELSTTLDKLSRSDGITLGNQIAAVQKAFKANGGKPNVGCPTGKFHEDTQWWPGGGKTQDFDGSQTGKGKGAIMLAPGAGQAFWVHGAIWARYSTDEAGLKGRGPRSVVGEPTGDEVSVTSSRGTSGAYQRFRRGFLYFNAAKNRTFFVANAIAQKYESVGLHKDQLGFPVGDEYAIAGGARSDFEGGHINWTASGGAVVVRNSQASPPTVGRPAWDTTPTAGQAFSGTVPGTGFVGGGSTQLYFCVNGSTTCHQQPPAGVTVNSATSLGVTNASLSAGSWQVYVKTPAGASAKSAAFTVQSPPPPTISRYSWSQSQTASRPFGGTITGTRFVTGGGTQVYFCLSGTNTCYQHPPAGVNVDSSTTLRVSNVSLGFGAWQVYVKTSAGQSALSTAFAVHPAPPTITRYSWSPAPAANQSFGGTVTGSDFIPAGTQVWFCVTGSNTCYQHPSAGVNVTNSSSLKVSGVKLGKGSWQVYVRTSAGASPRSNSFTVR